jgi:hypothetical protein
MKRDEFKEILDKVHKLYIEKGKDYGDSWYALGSKGVFVYVYNKVERLKNLFWNNKNPKFESIEDNMLDLITYSVLLYWGLQKDKKKKNLS